MSQLIPLETCTDASLVGVKAARLARISHTRFSTPPGFVIPANLHIEDGLSNDIFTSLENLNLEPATLRISAPTDNTTITSALFEINKHSILDTITKSKAANPGSAIIIQKSLNAEIWGTVYSTNPHTGAKNEIYIISSMYSIADPDPTDVFLLDKNTGSIIAEHDQPKDSILTPDHLENIHTSALEIERIFNHPIRIKFGFDTGKLVCLGIKPL